VNDFARGVEIEGRFRPVPRRDKRDRRISKELGCELSVSLRKNFCRGSEMERTVRFWTRTGLNCKTH